MAIMPRYQDSGITVATPQGQFRDTSGVFDALSQNMNRMTNFYFQEAEQQAKIEGAKYAADKAPTVQQIEEARITNHPLAPIADETTTFGQSANRALTQILTRNVSAAADIQLAKLQEDVTAGRIGINDIAGKTNALIEGYSSALHDIDPLSARSVEADLAIHGNRLFVSATKAAASRAVEQQTLQTTQAIEMALPQRIAQIYNNGDQTITNPAGDKATVSVDQQIKSELNRAVSMAQSLPISKQKKVLDDIVKYAKEGGERYVQEILIKGSPEDVKSVTSAIESGKFDGTIVDPAARMTLLNAANSRYNQLEKEPERINAAMQSFITNKLDDANAVIKAGKIITIPSEADLKVFTDPVKYQEAFNKLKAVQERQVLLSGFEIKPLDERKAILSLAETNQTDAKSVETYTIVKSAFDSLQEEIKKNPASYALKYPEVAKAAQDFESADPSVRQEKAIHYAQVSRQIQEANGVLPGDVKFLPTDVTKRMKDSYEEQVRSGQNWADVFTVESAKWGNVWPLIIRELKLDPAVGVIADMNSRFDSRSDARILAVSLIPENLKKLKDVVSSKDQNDLEGFVDTNMDKFNTSLSSPAQIDGVSARQSVKSAVTALALTYMTYGKSPSEAAQTAYNSVIGNAYDFGTGFRIPKNTGLAASEVEYFSGVIKANLASYSDQIKSIESVSNVFDKTEIKRQYIDSLIAHGSWVNTAKEDGLRLIDATGNPVVLNNGKFFEIPWSIFKGTIAKKPVTGTFMGMGSKQQKPVAIPFDQLGIH